MKPILVSVLIPSYNSEKWLAQTLRSVLNQTHGHLEIIVADDGSSDRSVQVASEFRNRGVRILELPHGGAARTRNLAFEACSGEYVQFLDSDDLLSPNKIETQLSRLAQEPDSVATCSWGRFHGNPETTQIVPASNWQDLEPVDWLVETWRTGEGMLFPAMWLAPRHLIERAGMWCETLSLNDDGEFFSRVALASRRILFCQQATAYYRSGLSTSLSQLTTRQGWESQFKSLELCEAHLLARENSARTRHVCSLLWQRFAHASYPYHRKLANRAITSASNLDAERVLPDGGPLFKVTMRLLGWKVARVMQVMSGRR